MFTPMSPVTDHYFSVLNLVLQHMLHELPESHRRELEKPNFFKRPIHAGEIGESIISCGPSHVYYNLCSLNHMFQATTSATLSSPNSIQK